MKKLIPILFWFLPACKDTPEEKPAVVTTNTKNIGYTAITSFPHDTTSFTEGLLIHEGQLFESTGHTDSYPFSRSLFGVVDRKSGKIDVKAEIDKSKYFGEGIAFLKGKVYQLTDTTHIGFIYDARTYRRLGEFHYAGDGWALTTDGSWLIMSNGSSRILYRDPVTFDPVKTLTVTENSVPVDSLNELELIDGYLYANRWLSNYIVKIDTASGKVVGKLDLSALAADAVSKYPDAAEMNGIAYDTAQHTVFITGKLWPAIYTIKIEP